MGTTLYAWYGDDFTGSTDVLESLAEGGIEAVLFLRPPDAALRARFADAQAVGLAGDSRSRSPEWMDSHLPGALGALLADDPGVLHYKTCSTFDSSPQCGSIGRALEIGRTLMDCEAVPVLVGAPHLRRFLVFGTLFAGAGEDVYRIDRHPTMSRHPVTPMHEGDMRRHLAQQTDLAIDLVDLPALQAGRGEESWEKAVRAGARAVFVDGVDEASLLAGGALVWSLAQSGPCYAVGSSGVTRALLAHWAREGIAGGASLSPRARGSEHPLLVVSGSCSPVTAAQIDSALADGFAGVAVDVAALARDGAAETARLVKAAGAALSAGRDCVIYSARGPLDSEGAALGETLGRSLGEVVSRLVRSLSVPRVLLAGGDTSSHAMARLDCSALTWLAPVEPGAPLCRAHSASPDFPELELVLKGGQMGSVDFFKRVRRTGA